MEGRRKEVGQRIKRERRRAGFRSQGAFAAAIGVHETTVANAERGSDRIGSAVYNAIEDGLKWPTESIEAYLAGGDEPPWSPPAHAASEPAGAPDGHWPTDAEIVAMTTRDMARISLKIEDASGWQAAEDWLFHALTVRRDAKRNLAVPQSG